MTIDEAIKHCLEVAEQNEFETRIYDELNRQGDEEYRNNHCQCATDHRQLAEWLTELKEAKQLLKAAVEDINWINEHTQDDDGSCIMRTNSGCSGCPLDINGDLFCKWKHADEALKLIGEDGEEE